MAENVSFNEIPDNIRVPGIYIEIDPSKAAGGGAIMERRLLLVGQRLANGDVSALIATRLGSQAGDQAAKAFGQGSMLHGMAAAARKADDYVDIWAIALDDDAAGVAAAGTVTFTGTPTLTGILALYIGGAQVRIAVVAGETVATLATRLADTINANGDLPVTASAALGVVTLTCRWKGETGNDLDVRANYYGEQTPAGLTVAIAAMSGGAANPSIVSVIDAIAGTQYYSIVCPYLDGPNLVALEEEMTDRFGPMEPLTGHVFNAKVGNHAALTTWGNSRNSPHISTFGMYDMPTPPWVVAAVWATVAESSGANDPARPFRSLPLPGVLPPPEKSRFTRPERNLALFDGISTFTVDQGGQVLIETIITNYQSNSFGLPDISLLRLETKWTVDLVRFRFNAAVARDYPRHKLGDVAVPGQAYATPTTVRATLIAEAIKLATEDGLIEDVAGFKRDLLIKRSTQNPNRMNAVLPPNLVNQFDIFAAAVQYRL
ncbi:phage tail sheath subtilisin-like domain-containing protein [Pseudomonas sp. Q2-TVG4-2]|uniref:phage tail sheath subtilisin-like domain-containing protein n=1 Tax=Pseudomonas sp. Q2-TVG4-2 TaxID=1685699 RepID=UPI0015E630B1|nr:phage tail sheath subtilisin-like domain-containing protein [Pseudomonas sp. Q2-TVG4-2]